MFMENSAELVIAVFAILKAGGVFTVINPTTKGRKLVYLLNDCGVRFLFAQPGLSRIVAEGAAEATALQEVIWSEAPADSAASVTMAQLQGEDDTPPRDPQLIDADLATISTLGFHRGQRVSCSRIATSRTRVGHFDIFGEHGTTSCSAYCRCHSTMGCTGPEERGGFHRCA